MLTAPSSLEYMSIMENTSWLIGYVGDYEGILMSTGGNVQNGSNDGLYISIGVNRLPIKNKTNGPDDNPNVCNCS